MECDNITLVQMYCFDKYGNVSWRLMEDCFLSSCFIPQTVPANLLIPLTVVYLFIFITGVFGNVSTCVVINNHYMLQTSTNCYLLNLAVADLVSLIAGIPFEIYLLWNQYPWEPPDFVCHLKAWTLETTSYVSVLTIVAFSIERYFAICHSFFIVKYSLCQRSYLKCVFILCWVVAGSCAIPYGVHHRADYVWTSWDLDPDYGPIKRSKMCMLALAFDPSLKNTFHTLFHISAACFFILPMLVLVGLYSRLGFVATRSRQILRAQNEAYTDYNSKKVSCMLVAVVFTFFLCYAPYQAQRLLFFYIDEMSLHEDINYYLYTVSGVLFYLSSTLNPVLYNVISARYRKAFRDVLCCHNAAKRRTVDSWNSSAAHHISMLRTAVGSLKNDRNSTLPILCKAKCNDAQASIQRSTAAADRTANNEHVV